MPCVKERGQHVQYHLKQSALKHRATTGLINSLSNCGVGHQFHNLGQQENKSFNNLAMFE